MDLLPVNLILEGGALRGIFTAGVLDALDEKNLFCEFVIGVSAGACMGISYVSRQRGRSRKISLTYCQDKRYFSWQNVLREGNLFGVQFSYEEIPRKLVPFDYETFEKTSMRFISVVTDCATGQAEYFENDTPERKKNMVQEIRASSSMPFVSKPVEINGRLYLDGGIADSIPLEYSMKNGHAKSVVVLTRPKGYLKKENKKLAPLLKTFLPRYPKLAEAMSNRSVMYNRELALVEKMEAEGKCLVIYPPENDVGRLERDRNKLDALYQAGYQAGLKLAADLPGFLVK